MKRSVCVIVIGVLASLSLCSAEQVTITGSVVGPEGEPIEGANVAVHYWAGETIWAEAASEADGKFELSFEVDRPGGIYRVVAAKEGHAIAGQRVERGKHARIILSDETGSITGTVTSVGGEPLQGIEVTVGVLKAPGEGFAGYVRLDGYLRAPRAETGEEGRFSIGGLPRGVQVGVAARGAGWATYAMAGSRSWPYTGDDITISLHPEAVISGRVLRDGEPVVGVRVAAQPQEATVGGYGDDETGEDGSYRIGGLPASTYNVILEPPEGYTAAACEGVKIAAGEHATDQDFELIEGAIVEGTVTCADTGEPAVGAGIGAYGPAHPTSTGWVQRAETDEDGRYELRLPPGRNKLYYMGGLEGYRHAQAEPKEVWVELTAGERKTNVDFLLNPAPKFVGVVLNPDGTPAPHVKLWIRGSSYSLGLDMPEHSDEGGRFSLIPRLDFPRQEPWVIFAQDEERGLAAAELVSEPAREVVMRLQRGGYLTAEVRDLAGKPMRGTGIRVLVGGRHEQRHLPLGAVSDENGRLRVGPLPSDLNLSVAPAFEVRNMATDTSWGDLGEFTLEQGETRELPPLVLNPEGRSLRGTVLDQEGDAVAGVVVSCLDGLDEGLVKSATDEDGKFELTGLKSRGTVRVVAYTPDGQRAFGMPCDPTAPFDPEFVLEPPAIVQGVTYDADGKPVAGVQVQLQTGELQDGHGLPDHLKAMDYTHSDEQGRWRFEGLVPGAQYSIFAIAREAKLSGFSERFVASGGPTPMEMDVHLK